MSEQLPISLGLDLYKILTKGNLVYEYNPFRNLRLTKDMYLYEGKYYDEYKEGGTLFRKNEVIDFQTDQLSFSITNPVDIQALPSYDGSVNLILNDGKNIPRLINSRFSPINSHEYLIVDRKGNNDTNLYDTGDKFDIQTSLYKRTALIPDLEYLGTSYGGNLSIGNYHFYFKYADADGNETDFVAESGLVSVFIGNTPQSIYSGFANENSHKLVSFKLSNIDLAYCYVRVYFTRDTAADFTEPVVQTHKITLNYYVNSDLTCNVVITGFENTTELTKDAINAAYYVCDAALTQAQALNMLFLGNLTELEIDYEELTDLSLRFLPKLHSSKYDLTIDKNYNITSTSKGYYDSKYIYNKVGYWPDEIYRFGIVYIMANNTLSPVFNVRGIKNLNTNSVFTDVEYKNAEGVRLYIKENTDYTIEGSNEAVLENTKGVISFTSEDKNLVLGITFNVKEANEVIEGLKKCRVLGFFFVRLKRIPTTLCQAFSTAIDKESHTPLVWDSASNKYITESFVSLEKETTKSNAKNNTILVQSFSKRKHTLAKGHVLLQGAYCPEYDVDPGYYNNMFNGDSLTIKEVDYKVNAEDSNNNYFFYKSDYETNNTPSSYSVKIIGVEDNTKLVGINDNYFSARAGEAEEAFRYEYIGYENNVDRANNLLRGSFGPFLGIVGYDREHTLFNIKIPEYNESLILEYFSIRYHDTSEFFAISDRMSIVDNTKYTIENNILSLNNPLYRGDCYICQFTHRVNRNFQDSNAPTNDRIVDKKTWIDNYKVSDGVVKQEDLEKVNTGDLNAVKLGMWVTFTVRATKNLCVRALDDSVTDEVSVTGHARGFYPYYSRSTAGTYKLPEALCYNKGFEKSLSYKYNYLAEDVPAILTDFSNRIIYSNIQATDSSVNQYRVFENDCMLDYTKEYGSITKLLEYNGSLICVFEHGIAYLTVNDKALLTSSGSGNSYIHTDTVLSDTPYVIADTYGSQWKDSIIKTPNAIYGVDTIAKKIWKISGSSVKIISDFSILEFLNNNISLTEREHTPIIGIRNVKTHYNAYKGDVLFTFYDHLYGITEKVWNLCYNEVLSKWVTFYSWVPSYSENIYNTYFSFDRNTSKYIAKLGISKSDSSFAEGIVLSNNVFTSESNIIGELSFTKSSNISKYEIIDDRYGNKDKFKIEGTTLSYTKDYSSYDKQIYYLNIKCYETLNLAFNVAGITSDNYYTYTIAVIPKEKLSSLTTDFWKHGLSNIIDIADEILPTNWYGKTHPFEFEFIVADNPLSHKIFDNLEIISNNAEPESFHYEVIGDCYEFAKDKLNMYVRQEATKDTLLNNAVDIVYDKDYSSIPTLLREIKSGVYDKSTLFPLLYYRQDTINEIEDQYHAMLKANTESFYNMTGAEIVRYKNLQEYRIWNHCQGINMKSTSRLEGNMEYKEDKWCVQIDPIRYVQCNESKWDNIPIELYLSNTIKNFEINGIKSLKNLPSYVCWEDNKVLRGEVKPKDKWIKIRIRYKGNLLAIISAIKTLYSISFA